MKKRYRPRLASLLALSESNYFLLMRILAKCERVGERRVFSISEQMQCVIDVIEVTRYTSLVEVYLQPTAAGNTQLNALIYPRMQIRLYHDARSSDILLTQGLGNIKPRYDYPNRQMHQPNEKQLMNQFLKDWLHMCLNMGYEPLIDFSYLT